MSAYRKNFDETKYMAFLIKDDESSKKSFGKRLKLLSIKDLILILHSTKNL